MGNKIYICMNIDFKNNKIRKVLSDAREMQKAFGNMAKKVSQRMEQLKAAPALSDMVNYQAARCHQLKGERKGEWIVDISVNHRMIFEINQNPVPQNKDGSVNTLKVTDIMIIETTDYH